MHFCRKSLLAAGMVSAALNVLVLKAIKVATE